MALFKYFSRETSVPKQLSFYTQKEKVVNDFVHCRVMQLQFWGCRQVALPFNMILSRFLLFCFSTYSIMSGGQFLIQNESKVGIVILIDFTLNCVHCAN